ncbi:uncharacterized protein LOC119332985 [Triticum dicoccoides]|uniref:uncharacterized protein LOC119332985 n=1 Tax=Triticum dicoccoides TaxID=85692 RepID=UPI0018916CC7|nr:uncharacterized protein LOC119332985 [Triticum dicoccoides]
MTLSTHLPPHAHSLHSPIFSDPVHLPTAVSARRLRPLLSLPLRASHSAPALANPICAGGGCSAATSKRRGEGRGAESWRRERRRVTGDDVDGGQRRTHRATPLTTEGRSGEEGAWRPLASTSSSSATAAASTLVAVVASVSPSSAQGGPDRPAAGALHDVGVGKLERLADPGASFSGARIPWSPTALASTLAAAAAPTRARSWRNTSRCAACTRMLQATEKMPVGATGRSVRAGRPLLPNDFVHSVQPVTPNFVVRSGRPPDRTFGPYRRPITLIDGLDSFKHVYDKWVLLLLMWRNGSAEMVLDGTWGSPVSWIFSNSPLFLSLSPPPSSRWNGHAPPSMLDLDCRQLAGLHLHCRRRRLGQRLIWVLSHPSTPPTARFTATQSTTQRSSAMDSASSSASAAAPLAPLPSHYSS